VVEHRHFWYDGWHLMAETVANPASGAPNTVAAVTQRYIWGLDLAGDWERGMGKTRPQGSSTRTGVVGALLGVITADGSTYSVCNDANGNVMGLIDLDTTTLTARFDYDAFGNQVTDWSAPGHHAWEISRIRFSSKRQDPNTGWLYYGYRWYDAENGRWPSRDPIEEQGGINLYGMVGNDPLNRLDYLGLLVRNPGSSNAVRLIAGIACADGPLPVGDTIALGVAHGLVVYEVSSLVTDPLITTLLDQLISDPKFGPIPPLNGEERRRKEKRDDCQQKYEAYKKTSRSESELRKEAKRLLDNAHNSREHDKDRLCQLLRQYVDLVNKEKGERQFYVDSGCDEFDWNNIGNTQGEREAKHRRYLRQMEGAITNLIKDLEKFCKK